MAEVRRVHALHDGVAPAVITGRNRPLVVTGGAGFLGSNIADRVAGGGGEVVILDSLERPGVEHNLAWLKDRHGSRIHAVIDDIRDPHAVADAVADAGAVFHLAAQVAVTTSLADPMSDFQVNAAGTVTLLEALRTRPAPPPTVFASTNKVYGDLGGVALTGHDDRYLPADEALRGHGIGEDRPLCFYSPYGCSKGAADQYVIDYARTFGLPATVLRMSCLYGPRQFGTEDQGWVAHFLISALRDAAITLYGDGRQVRDVLYVDDAVGAFLAALRDIDRTRGRAFNLGGGPRNAVSLLSLIKAIERLLGRPVRLRHGDWRPGDQLYYVSDTRRFAEATGWRAEVPWPDGLGRLARWLIGHPSLFGETISPDTRLLA